MTRTLITPVHSVIDSKISSDKTKSSYSLETVCCSVLHCIALHGDTCVIVYCSVLQRVAVRCNACCSMLQCAASEREMYFNNKAAFEENHSDPVQIVMHCVLVNDATHCNTPKCTATHIAQIMILRNSGGSAHAILGIVGVA